MITLTLIVGLLLLGIILVAVLGVGGIAIVFIFGDVIIFGLIVALIVKLVRTKKK